MTSIAAARTACHPNTAVRRWVRPLGLALALFMLSGAGGVAQAEPPAEGVQDLLIATHLRLQFDKDVSRVAVADPDIIQFETLTNREVLVLGKNMGRTSVMVWFADGEARSYLFQVRRDLSILEAALKDIHPSIVVQSAPDRDAVVLRGTVPDMNYSNAAEDTAQRYLAARKSSRRTAAPVVRSSGPDNGAPPTPAIPGTPPPAEPPSTVEPTLEVESSAAVINLIRVEQLPGRTEERMQAAIAELGAGDVRVQRLVRGRVASDADDVFLLTGAVENQSMLVRAISVAQSMLGTRSNDQMKVIADEGGALKERSQSDAGLQSGGSSSLSQFFSSNVGQSLKNLVGSNLGRAKIVEAAGGRILSFLEVTDLPQVRVDIRLYEVNCTKLRSFGSNWGSIATSFGFSSLNPSTPGRSLQGLAAPRVGSQGGSPDIQNVLGFLSGTLTNQIQVAGDGFAFDWILSMLEEKGFARSLSRPSLTVLSGESALFQVGGEIPIPTSFATNVATDGVFNSVVFRPFGVQLAVRPLVGEGGDVTIDLAPTVSLPDAQLTAGIRESTGQTQSTTSFRTRSLQTTARLVDGQSLLVGGLISRNVSSADTSTPGLSDLPVVGGAFSNYQRQGDEFQLIVAVHPVVLRKPDNRARSWAFPTLPELLSGACGR